MATTSTALLALGLTGQALYGLRTLVQWAVSERAGRCLVPPAYWVITALAALLLSAYAVLRGEPILVCGPLLGLGLALRNLALQAGPRLRVPPRALLPLALAAGGAVVTTTAAQALRQGAQVPAPWLAVGVAGQALWTARFVVQWWASERRGQSVLPASFWWLSTGGAVLLAAYATSRAEWVFVLSYAFNPVPYVRNLALLRRAGRAAAAPGADRDQAAVA